MNATGLPCILALQVVSIEHRVIRSRLLFRGIEKKIRSDRTSERRIVTGSSIEKAGAGRDRAIQYLRCQVRESRSRRQTQTSRQVCAFCSSHLSLRLRHTEAVASVGCKSMMRVTRYVPYDAPYKTTCCCAVDAFTCRIRAMRSSAVLFVLNAAQRQS